jgi:hypothetical protein
MRGFDGAPACSSQYRRHPTIDINHLNIEEIRCGRGKPNRGTNHVISISPAPCRARGCRCEYRLRWDRPDRAGNVNAAICRPSAQHRRGAGPTPGPGYCYWSPTPRNGGSRRPGNGSATPSSTRVVPRGPGLGRLWRCRTRPCPRRPRPTLPRDVAVQRIRPAIRGNWLPATSRGHVSTQSVPRDHWDAGVEARVASPIEKSRSLKRPTTSVPSRTIRDKV